LLVDADLRRPNLTEALGSTGAETAPFIAQLERPRLDYSPAIVTLEGERTCDFVPGIRAQAHAAGLLERALQTRLALWKRRYDYIVLDCPPVLPYADALAVAHQCSGVVVCVPSRTSTPAEITHTTHLLRTHGANVLGTVLLGADAGAGSRDAASRFGGPGRRRSRATVRSRTTLGDR
jgi:tyrosine-protein kinase Etk/Wzc